MGDFKRSDFDILNRAVPSGRVCEAVDLEIYWFHAIAKCDEAFTQSRNMHRHKFFELHFILDGSITYRTAGGELILNGGEYVLFAPGQSHKIETYTQSFIKCSAAFTVGEGEELYGGLVQGSSVGSKIPDTVEDGIRFISELSEKQTPYYGVLVKNRLFEIIHTVAGELNFKKRRETLPDGGGDMRVFKAKQFIKDNPHVFLGCDDMAAYCELSVKQLNRLFLQHEGVSLLAYIHEEKLNQARLRLKETASSLREISEELGFSSVYYFSRFFLKHTGMTPGEYRKNGSS